MYEAATKYFPEFITKEDLNDFIKFIYKNFKVTKTYNKINDVHTKRLDISKLKSTKWIIKGHEVTEEEIDFVYDLLKKNNIPMYEKVYRIAMRRYVVDILLDKNNNIAIFPKNSEEIYETPKVKAK